MVRKPMPAGSFVAQNGLIGQIIETTVVVRRPHQSRGRDRLSATTFMQPQFESPARLAFGPFEVNVPERQLVKSGVRVRLSGHPFQV